MYFTREPIIETIITPREGYKLVLRNTKAAGQEEFIVDALEVVSFGTNLFFRSTERPKSFLVPVSDFEVLEVRETRMALKTLSIDRGIKIGGGRETSLKQSKEGNEKELEVYNDLEAELIENESKSDQIETPKRRERKRFKKKRGKDDRLEQIVEDLIEEEPEGLENPFSIEDFKEDLQPWNEETTEIVEKKKETTHENKTSSGIFSNLLPPPTTLISETISKYKDTPLFAGAFYSKTEKSEEENEVETEEDEDNLNPTHIENQIDEEENSSKPENSEGLPF